ncbi:MAG: TonB-dependent receptor [Haliscomenobacteraceae bacterium CHB4]|nr:Vitamin B12 transporter BtuB [Saprospiraceae bacterium]MCE7926044.1 TonB-dependent receptor [Haliscomenobacteraceae bacterium CHB4]
MKLSLPALLLIVLFTSNLDAQYLFGQVTDAQETPLPGAVVAWAGTTIGARTDDKGEFAIPLPQDTTQKPLRLAAIFGALRDTFLIEDLTSYWTLAMSANVTLQEVTVRDEVTGAYISVLQPVKTEIINRAELRKAACCDLAGCFETQSTVQPTTTNILTNARELRILGLSGVYNQVLVDGLPTIQGLTYTYGTGTIPGSMLENIWVVKGANSVLQGYEGMVGQITVFPREGGIAEPVTADVLVNSFGEKHLNVAWAANKTRWTNYLALHTSQPGGKWDRDDDTFLDLPRLTRYSVYNKWRYRKENENGLSAFIGARYVDEQRIGGQGNFDPEKDEGTTNAYGQTVRFRQPEIFGKTGWRFNADNKISLLASFVAQDQNSWFGLTRYDADQRHAYVNVQYEFFWGKNKAQELKTGISFRHFILNESVGFAAADTLGRSFAGTYRREENIPGVFAENTFHFKNDRWVWIAGLRADRHNAFGWYVTPRTMLRFNPSPNLDLRASVGAGWRTVNLFPENIALLVGSRDIVFAESLRPERAWNAGINVTRRFAIGKMRLTATADFYHTRFQNQFFPDYDADPTKAIIANFGGKSISNGVQLEGSAAWGRRLELRTAYNFLDVFRHQDGRKVSLPFNPRHKILGVATFRTPGERWQFDANLHWYGRQRLPDTSRNPENLRRPDHSKAYSVVGAQVRRALRRFDVFAGCENVFDFRQLQPILGWEQPFARGFDPSFAWGPTRGREFYIGFNFKLEKRNVEN